MIYLIPQIIDRAAEQNPELEAVKYYDQSLTYAQLVVRTNSLSNFLMENGIKSHDRVGICLDKSLESAVSIYGVMKAGATYVPLDPSAPVSRLSHIIRDCGLRHIVTQDSKTESIRQILAEGCVKLDFVIGISPDAALPVTCFSWDDVFSAPSNKPNNLVLIDQDLAYIIYTSGSTGYPKGIMHTHYSGLSFAKWAANTYGFNNKDRLTNQAPLHFDMSLFDFFAGAVAGATTVIIPDDYMRLPASYSKFLVDEKISVIFTVPFTLSQMLFRGVLPQRDLRFLRWIIFGGDTHSPTHIRQLMKLLPHTRFSHMYGPAETNGCIYYNFSALPDDLDEHIPIGKPCKNMESLVVDENDRPVSVGGSGELLMRGPTLMRGYWNRPEVNKQVFYCRDIFKDYKEVFYRTGDMVEILLDGNFKFLGRKDRQIKIRGYRVELDEIEMTLLSHKQVEETAAFSVPDGQNNHYIEAVVKVECIKSVTSNELIKHLKNQLPWYAIPKKITIIEVFPRTPTGKIDRRGLQIKSVAES